MFQISDISDFQGLTQCCGVGRWIFGGWLDGAKVESEMMPKPLNPIADQLQSLSQPAVQKFTNPPKKIASKMLEMLHV